MEYSQQILSELKKKGIRPGDYVVVEKDVHTFSGLLMPKSQGDSNSLIVKLDNGYNTGINFDKNTKIKKGKGEQEKRPKAKIEKYKPDPTKPTIAILSTGGTVASRIDYSTGAVTPLETAEDIISAIPEIKNIANIRIRPVFQMASDDIESYHWMTLAKKIEDEIDSGVDGIIITHGTDTMHYTSAALSLMVQNSPIPILLVGSQRSSDRGSSDASMNLLCAAQFIANSDFSGVAICMHGSASDDFCYIHPGLHVRKMHTSRRDAFRSIDVLSYAKIDHKGAISFLRNDYSKKDKKRKPHIVDRYDNRVALVKIYPGFDYHILEFFEKAGYRGVILEGTGLGHAPISQTDDATKLHPKLLETIRRMIVGGIIIGMTSQCAYGKVNMNVYRPQRIMQEAGILPLYMTPETALVKMGWSLGHTKNSEDAKKILLTNVAGEILDRVDVQAYE
ncbi:MAG: Glu-tRNA(Gln) amidotransferase subunit GatD [Candidatus Aenigmarchaeota archaeon]|nr:Glu-tRNA(Gln) amidotransferase subunit GatD [Candidatus Aenigmarchaeota archaeon]